MKTQLAPDFNLLLDTGTGSELSASGVGDGNGTTAYVDLGADVADYPSLVAEVNIQALTNTGNKTYKIGIQQSTTTNFAATPLVSEQIITAAGRYVIPFNPVARYVRVAYTLGGTDPALTKGVAKLNYVSQ